MVVGTQNFLHLDISIVAKILDSSELNIHTEVEVFNAVNTWLKHNSKERSKYAKQLLLKIRLPLLSEHALKYILDKVSPFSKKNELMYLLNEVMNKKQTAFQNNINRNCSQKKFNLLVYSGFNRKTRKYLRDIHQVNGNNFKIVKSLPLTALRRKNSEAVCLKGEVYVFGGRDYGMDVMSVAKYSPVTNKWTVVAKMFDKRQFFCVCPFMDNIYIYGGKFETTYSCVQFDTTVEMFSDKSWKEIARMKETRYSAACTVFKGKIIVSGGKDNYINKLKTVEFYDVFGDKWTSMPSMINSKCLHSLVTLNNKLFVIGYGSDSCEVFDNFNKKFVDLKSPYSPFNLNKALSIGNKILIFINNSSLVFSYDFDKDEWSQESCKGTTNLKDFSYAKLPSY